MGTPLCTGFLSGKPTSGISLVILGELCTGVTSVEVADIRPREEYRELMVSVARGGSGYAMVRERGYWRCCTAREMILCFPLALGTTAEMVAVRVILKGRSTVMDSLGMCFAMTCTSTPGMGAGASDIGCCFGDTGMLDIDPAPGDCGRGEPAVGRVRKGDPGLYGAGVGEVGREGGSCGERGRADEDGALGTVR